MKKRPRVPKKVQIRVRVEAADRDGLQREADRRGVSLNVEVSDRIRSGTLVRILSEGEYTLSDLQKFHDYVQVVKLALRNAGEDEDLWLGYAGHVPFPESNLAKANALVAQAVEEQLREDHDWIRQAKEKFGGVPSDDRRAEQLDDSEPISPAAEYRWRAERIRRIESRRPRQASPSSGESN
jgi:hypothetical protein